MKIFDTIQLRKPKRSVFDLSHERKFSCNMGDLVPILCQEVIPGDSWRLSLQQLVRFQPLLAPMMHNVNVYTHFFFVPNRIIWNEWEDFITGGEDGTKKPVFPTFYRNSPSTKIALQLQNGSLADYLGVPVANIPQEIPSLTHFSQLPFRAYHTIFNEFYRDQNLEPKINVPKSSGSTQITTGTSDTWENQAKFLRKRAWEKDYFTSALPFAQKGEQLSIPLSADKAPVQADGFDVQMGTKRDGSNYDVQASSSSLSGKNLEVDLENVTASTINDLRKAFNVQRWLEKNARGGSRYVEQLLMHFGFLLRLFANDLRPSIISFPFRFPFDC